MRQDNAMVLWRCRPRRHGGRSWSGVVYGQTWYAAVTSGDKLPHDADRAIASVYHPFSRVAGRGIYRHVGSVAMPAFIS